jgi:isocitrate/isopropylmalate dehydrogenase
MLKVFEEGKVRTRDIGGTARTSEFADAIISKMKTWVVAENKTEA